MAYTKGRGGGTATLTAATVLSYITVRWTVDGGLRAVELGWDGINAARTT